VIAGDMPCLHCGYNLRGLQGTGRCPECGRAVLDTILRTTLHRATPASLLRLRSGLLLLVVAGVLVAGAGLMSGEPLSAVWAFGAGGGRYGVIALMVAANHRVASLMLGAVAIAVHVGGTFRVTDVRGLLPVPEATANLRNGLRVLAIVLTCATPLAVIETHPISEIAIVTVVIVEMGQSIATLLYLHGITQTAGFRGYRRAFNVCILLWSGHALTVTPLFEFGLFSDAACGLVTAIVMILLSLKLGRIARDNRRRGVMDHFEPSAEIE
jgi:hypothetical protein